MAYKMKTSTTATKPAKTGTGKMVGKKQPIKKK
jgi:hypothetical protein